MKTNYEKVDKLEKAAEATKAKFYNLDREIDQFKDYLSPWYVSPELLSRPLVINMWGMTGVGKTQMVREFMAELGLSNFMRTHICGSTVYNSLITDMFSDLELETDISKKNNNGIIFLDEFHNVTTKDSKGSRKEKGDESIWSILSTGKIPLQTSRRELMETYANLKSTLEFKQKRIEELKKDGKEYSEDSNNKISTVWGAWRFKRQFKINKPVLEVMTMGIEERLVVIKNALDHYEENTDFIDFSKTLFIICGNLDGAFGFSSQVSSVEVDPDIIADSCKEVSIFDIKTALSYKLFPEEIARLGNNHIIFTSIDKNGYKHIIKEELERISSRTKELSGISLKFDASIERVLFKNGVFPTQGTRPTFSTIQGMIESNIPKIVYSAAPADKEISISYDESSHEIFTSNGKRISCVGSVDEVEIRLEKDFDDRMCTCVHESTHAIVYAELFNAIPANMVSIVTDNKTAAGYITTHAIRHTKTTMRNYITVAVAGMVGEETVFGKDMRTVGCGSDLILATNMAAKYVRLYAFTDDVKAVIASDPAFYNNVSGTSEFINKMIKECIKKAYDILQENIEFHKSLSQLMYDKKRVSPEEFETISQKYGKKYRILKYNTKITPNFKEIYEQFSASNVKDIEEIGMEAMDLVRSFFGSSSMGEPNHDSQEMTFANDDGIDSFFR
jgi:cell division protease FtsH